jgi:hypothetical protein
MGFTQFPIPYKNHKKFENNNAMSAKYRINVQAVKIISQQCLVKVAAKRITIGIKTPN